MAKHVLTKEQLVKGIETLEKAKKLFQGLRPDQMVRVARSNGIKTLPKKKEEMALLVMAFKNLRFDKKMWAMVKEVRSGHDGKVSLIMGNVDQSDMDKHKHYVVPKGQLYDLKEELRNIY
jgi:hypothetical protein